MTWINLDSPAPPALVVSRLEEMASLAASIVFPHYGGDPEACGAAQESARVRDAAFGALGLKPDQYQRISLADLVKQRTFRDLQNVMHATIKECLAIIEEKRREEEAKKEEAAKADGPGQRPV